MKEKITAESGSSTNPGFLSGAGVYTGSETETMLGSSGSSYASNENEGLTIQHEVILGPCDGDIDESDNLAYWQCLTLSYDALTYYTCPSGASANYTETLQVVTDRNCPFEDRIAQCELEGGEVSSNIYQNRRELFEPVLSRVEEDIYVSKY